MLNIPSIATQDEIKQFTQGLIVPPRPTNTQYAAMAYLGMCRHKYMTPDWLICQFAWDESFYNIIDDSPENAKIIKSRIESYYQSKGFTPNK